MRRLFLFACTYKLRYTTYMHNNRKKTQHIWIVFLITLLITVTVGIGAMYVISGKTAATDSSDKAENAKSPEANSVTAQIMKIEDTKDEPAEEPTDAEQPDNSRYGAILADEELCAKQHIYTADAMYEDEIKLLFAGDISLAEGYSIIGALRDKGGDISAGFSEDTLSVMRDADVFMLNNEFTYSNRGEPTPDKQYTFRANPANVHYLTDMGVDIVSLANNHTYDYGQVSLLDTLDTLEGINMPYVGAGRNLEEAMQPTYYIVNDTKIAFVSATQIERNDNPDTKGATKDSPGTFRCWYNDRVLEVVKEAADNSDYVVAYIHWGTELEENTDWAQDELAPKLASAGADLIIGDHPHILQRLDYAGTTPIIFSLGNYWFNSKAQDTGLLEVIIDTDGNTKSVRFIPALQSGCRTAVVAGEEKARILNYMQSISPHVSIDSDGYITKK